MKKRIAITGMGIVSALGIGTRETLEALQQERSGIGRVRYLDTSYTDIPVGEVPLSNAEMCQRLNIDPDIPRSRTALIGTLALQEALTSARLTSQRPALISGTTVGGIDRSELFYPQALTRQVVCGHDNGANTNEIADHTALFNMTLTVSTACSAALNALILGARMIEAGERDVVVVGGTEALSHFHFNGFKSLMILDNEPCKPFDLHRKGLNLGEGAAYLVLESEQSAQRRQVPVLAELCGVGNACDAFHQTASSPDGQGAFLAMTQALQSAGLEPRHIDYLNAHGTATPNNDETESKAIHRLFGKQLPFISSTKGLTGHTTSASGAVESVLCVLALQEGLVLPNGGFHTPDPSCITPVTRLQRASLNHVMCNAFAFGGNDSCVIFGKAHRNETPPAASPTYKALRKVYITKQIKGIDENEYKEHLSPMQARRMGPLLKRALVTALKAIKESGVPQPDAIINGTAMGCLDNSEKILDAWEREGDAVSMPTQFMQSTHNTVASLIALHTGNHGYNCTYSHRGASFAAALYDAWLQIGLGDIDTALVCHNDYLPEGIARKLQALGILPPFDTDVSEAWMLSAVPGPHPVAELTAVSIVHYLIRGDKTRLTLTPCL